MPRPFPEEKRQEWKRLVELWESGDHSISITRWCSEKNINYNAFLYWRERFGARPIKPLDRSAFKELPYATAMTGVTLEYHHIRIQLAENFSAATLAQCLRVLREVV